MGEPRNKTTPTLQDVAIEMTSAMSALNMPDPEHCPPDMVKHAYEHLEAAMEMLVALMPLYNSALETAAGERPSVFDAQVREARRLLADAGVFSPFARQVQVLPTPTLYRDHLGKRLLAAHFFTSGGNEIPCPGWWAEEGVLTDLLRRLAVRFNGLPDDEQNRRSIADSVRWALRRLLDQGDRRVYFEEPKKVASSSGPEGGPR